MHFLLAVLPLLLSHAHGQERCPDGWLEAHAVGLGCLYCKPPGDAQTHEEAKTYCAGKHNEVGDDVGNPDHHVLPLVLPGRDSQL